MARHREHTPHLVQQMPTVLLVGAESLLGKEVRERLEISSIPAQIKLISVEEEGGILTVKEGEPIVIGPLGLQDLDGGKVVVLAGTPESSAQAFERVQTLNPRPMIVDVTGALDNKPGAQLRAPLAELHAHASSAIQLIAHPAAIVLALFLKRLQQAGMIHRSVIEIFEPASERGQRGLDELQQQTVGLLAFQKLKKEVYDAQASFNMLAQFGSDAPLSLAEIEARIDRQLTGLLSSPDDPPVPSLRLIQAPVFHGYSFSAFVEFEKNPGVEALSKALASSSIELRRSDQEPPSNVGAAGQSGIAVGNIVMDRHDSRACWFWIVADNLRIAADNAVQVVAQAFLPVLILVALFFTSCGYHVSGKSDLLPKNLHTIAIPRFDNVTVRYRLTDRLPEAIAREFIARTRYQIVPDPNQADAILQGAIVSYNSYPTVFDQRTGRASGLQVNVTMQVRLIERATGKVLFSRPGFEMKQRYEFSPSSAPQAYFDETDTAVDRLSHDVARDVVSAILESF